MQVFLRPPAAQGNGSEMLRATAGFRSAVLACRSRGELLEAAFREGSGLMPADHVVFMADTDSGTYRYGVHPAYKGSGEFFYARTPEQEAVLLNSYDSDIVRICSADDYGVITLHALKKYMREAQGSGFSLIFLRRIVNGVTLLAGFVTFRGAAYGEREAGLLFAVGDALMAAMARLARPKPLARPDDTYFGIANLPGMQKIVRQVYDVAREDVPVLLLGETGVGKEGVANLIYRASDRNSMPFIKINCGGIPATLVESKLFGHEKGAFTGADRSTPGCFEAADGGVLMLDELGDLPVDAQAVLLRTLQEGTVQRLGSNLEIPVNVRIIAATNRDVLRMAGRNLFRRDLLYRLAVYPMRIPPLRERREDIPVLLNYFILRECRKRGFPRVPALASGELDRLCRHSWPGNIREMQNAVVRSILMWKHERGELRIVTGADIFGCTSGLYLLEDAFLAGGAASGNGASSFPGGSAVPKGVGRTEPVTASPTESGSCGLDGNKDPDITLDEAQRRCIRAMLGKTGGRVSGRGGAAERLGINAGTLRGRMRKLGILPR